MAGERWAEAVRAQLALGRLLPLGEAAEGAWIAEAAAASVLRRCTAPGTRVASLRLELADPAGAGEPAVPPPGGALAPGALLVTARCEAAAGEPLPVVAGALRAELWRAAAELGLVVEAVDVHVAALLDEVPEAAPVVRPEVSGTALAGLRVVRESPGHAEAHIEVRSGRLPLEAAREARASVPAPVVTVLVTAFR
ncbi:hypothetical protein SRB5_24150 [Streptomyces sp. RB5]|uniref:Nucleopolyhedrovirus P10 family protein n=1 Tax=Streptomyces smaragdinus TaxID=2585196 RepID=A0A7K0CGZ0_9ACTN|nr:nucleopolyhedrovirus P10 family protein [Streptomyces smaragdinus]MQY12282.1 hypothetical protein [Streptomyces smaragdinus]